MNQISELQLKDNQYVVFTINEQLYSLQIEDVLEILRVPVITIVPGINHTIEGVINLRGSIIPVVSLHKRFNLMNMDADKKNRVVIVQGNGESIGLIVEEVKMVTRFYEQNVEPVSGQIIDEDLFKGYAKHEDQVIGILNIEKVLYT